MHTSNRTDQEKSICLRKSETPYSTSKPAISLPHLRSWTLPFPRSTNSWRNPFWCRSSTAAIHRALHRLSHLCQSTYPVIASQPAAITREKTALLSHSSVTADIHEAPLRLRLRLSLTPTHTRLLRCSTANRLPLP
jgi:hypothetical protein